VTANRSGDSGDPSQWVMVATAGDVPPGAAICAPAGDGEVAVFNLDGELVAVEARCLHKGGALAEGHVSDGVVTCPLHWWRYDLRTGERLGAPDLRLASYPVRVLDGRVEVLMPNTDRPSSAWRDRLLAAARQWEADQQIS
jgi:3-phenylpropionate/trans-cinnamate dioxygenase ferredoxin component